MVIINIFYIWEWVPVSSKYILISDGFIYIDYSDFPHLKNDLIDIVIGRFWV